MAYSSRDKKKPVNRLTLAARRNDVINIMLHRLYLQLTFLFSSLVVWFSAQSWVISLVGNYSTLYGLAVGVPMKFVLFLSYDVFGGDICTRLPKGQGRPSNCIFALYVIHRNLKPLRSPCVKKGDQVEIFLIRIAAFQSSSYIVALAWLA